MSIHSGKLYTRDDLHKMFVEKLYHLASVRDWQVEVDASELLAKYTALMPGYLEGKQYEINRYMEERDLRDDAVLGAFQRVPPLPTICRSKP